MCQLVSVKKYTHTHVSETTIIKGTNIFVTIQMNERWLNQRYKQRNTIDFQVDQENGE